MLPGVSGRRRSQILPLAHLLAVALALGTGCSEGSAPPREDTDGRVPFPNRRPHFDQPAELAVISNNGDDTLTLVDLAVPEIVGVAPIGIDPVDIDGPHHVAFDRARGEVLAALAYPLPPVTPGGHAGHDSAQRNGVVLRLALPDLSPLGTLEVATNPGEIVLSEDGSLLAVSHFDLIRALRELDIERKRATVALVDPRSIVEERAEASFVTTCAAPHGIALSRPSGDRAYVACYGEDALAIVDTTDPRSEPELVSLGPGGRPGRPLYGPYAAILSPDGDLIAVSATQTPGIHLFDVEENGFVATLPSPMGAAPYFVAWAEDALLVPFQGPDGVGRLPVSGDGRPATRWFDEDECEKPHEVVLSHSSRVFLVCEGDHVGPGKLLELDPESLETLAELELGVYPDRLAIGAPP